jgi:hypothetical protein
MAWADYHICDHCGERKTFYDADHNLDWSIERDCYVYDPVPGAADGSYPGLPGYRVWSLCHECEKTHEIVIRPKSGSAQ